ncbi:hypothetical protein HZR00_17245 [Elizabethkingia anophelis]|nr:hypothetical protein [Elizabethkingia anophelis]
MASELTFSPPSELGMLTNNDIVFGAAISPIDRIKIFSPEDFENFTREWVIGYLMKKGTYHDCKKCSGAGDMGRDVIAKIDSTKYDNYQCKHYDAPLTPSDVFKELIKLIYYSSIGEYKIPEKYYFVSPCGAGPKLNGLIERPKEFKAALYDNWERNNKIGSSIIVKLDSDIEKYIDENLNFEIFDCIDPQVLIDQHKQTSYHAPRFGGGLLKRVLKKIILEDIQDKEQIYTSELFKAYSEFKKKEYKLPLDLDEDHTLSSHFQRQRIGFFSADALNQYSRDSLPPDSDYFEDLKDQIYMGIADIADQEHENGFDKVKATVQAAQILNITSSPLVSNLRIEDRIGICHHLVNDKKIKWAKDV